MAHVNPAPAKRRCSLLVTLLLAASVPSLVSACSSSASTSDIKVQSAADKKANLAGYKTFAWLETDSVVVDRTGVWAERDFDTRTEIQFLVDQALRRRGLTVSQGEPDLLIDLSILAEVQDVEEKKVEDEKKKVEEANEQNKISLYYRNVALAFQRWHSGEVPEAEQLLADCPAELRGWEWHYLRRLCTGLT